MIDKIKRLYMWWAFYHSDYFVGNELLWSEEAEKMLNKYKTK